MFARKNYTSLFFYLCALEGAAVIAALLLIPSEGGTLSPARLALIAFALLFMVGWIYASRHLSADLAFFEASRFLYPRFFRKNTGLSSANPSPAFALRDYSRLGFLLLNEKSTPAVLPAEKLPGPVPHAADVIVLACQRAEYVDVRLLAFPQLDRIYQSAPLSEPCSP
jgi:hypothetical protein